MSIKIKEYKNEKDLHKMTIIELKEAIDRENNLLKHRKVISQLPDKGECIRKFKDKLENELKNREALLSLEESLNKLRIDCNENVLKDKHVKYVCKLEKIPAKDRFKPFCTLNTEQVHNPNSKATQLIEDASFSKKPTKLINLPESLVILSKQDKRVKEEQLRNKFERELEKLKEAEETHSDDSSISSCSDVEE